MGTVSWVESFSGDDGLKIPTKNTSPPRRETRESSVCYYLRSQCFGEESFHSRWWSWSSERESKLFSVEEKKNSIEELFIGLIHLTSSIDFQHQFIETSWWSLRASKFQSNLDSSLFRLGAWHDSIHSTSSIHRGVVLIYSTITTVWYGKWRVIYEKVKLRILRSMSDQFELNYICFYYFSVFSFTGDTHGRSRSTHID